MKHSDRIVKEHSYSISKVTETSLGSLNDSKGKARNVPLWLQRFGRTKDKSNVNCPVPEIASSDGVYNYAAAVLTDGLLLKQFRDANMREMGTGCSYATNFFCHIFTVLDTKNTQLSAFAI